MGWPLSQEYNEAVQNPRTSFSDPDLKAGEVVPGPLGIPMPRSGNFADVYQVRGTDGRMWAIKCFTRPASGLRERYLQIDAQLRAARLPFSVGFEFLPEGVRIRGLWYPALKMEWVEGLPLNTFVRQNVDKPDHLKAILGLWVRLCKRLRDSKIAHADLQHGNVLLVPGATANTLKLRLIDYDGMWVPALAKIPSGESGHPAYQHPDRLRNRAYSSDVDRFPHLVIGCALRALAVAGKPLWDRFDNGDNLLFRESDFANPVGSLLFRALWDLNDPTVTNLVALLIVSAQRPIGDTPWLDEVLSGDSVAPVGDAVLAHAADTLGVPRRTVGKPLPMAHIYVVPQEANEFSELGAGSRLKRRSRGMSVGVALLAGGSVLAAAAIIGIVLATRDGSPTTPDNPDDQTQVPPITVEPDKPRVVQRTGIVKTNWSRIAAGKPVEAPKSLLTGLDTAPPGTKIIRSFPQAGIAALGAWVMPGGKHALVASRQGLGELDLHTGQLQGALPAQVDLTHATVTADGKYAVVAVKAKSIHCIDLATAKEKWSQAFPGVVGVLVVTADGQRVIVSGDHVGCIEWAVASGAELRRHELLQANHLALSPDEKLAIATNDGGVELWSLDDATVTPLAPTFAANAVCVSRDGKLAFAAGGQVIRSWELPEGKPLPDRPSPVKSPIVALSVSSDGTIVVGSQTGEIGLIGPEDATTISLDGGPVAAIALTADGEHGLFATERSNPTLCRVGDLVRPFGPSKIGPTIGCLEYVRSVQMQPGFTQFASDAKGDRFLAASDSRVYVYDANKFQKIDGFQLQKGKLVSAGFAPDGNIVVCQADDERFQTYYFDLKKSEAGKAFELPNAALRRVSRVVPVYDRAWVVATTDPAGDVLFDPETGKPPDGWPMPKSTDPAVAVPSPDGRRIAIGRPNESVRLWDCETMRLGARCEGSTGVNALAYTPDGTRIIGLWFSGRMRIWDSITGNLEKEVDHEYAGPFTDLAAITNDTIVLGSANGRFMLNVDTSKALNVGNGIDPLAGRGTVVSARGWALAVDRDDRLAAWQVNSKLAASLAPKPPARKAWPEISLLRDLPTDSVAGLVYVPDGESVIVASQTGKLTRYSADRLHYLAERDVREGPIRAMTLVGDRIFLLGKRTDVSSRDAKMLDKPIDFPGNAPAGAAPNLFSVHPEGTLFLIVTDKLHVTDTKTKKEITPALLPRAALNKPLTQFAYSADGKVGVARWANSVTAVWHPKFVGTSRILEELKTPVEAPPNGLVLSPDGKFAILATSAGRIIVWDTTNGKTLFNEEVYPAAGVGDAVAAIAMLPGGFEFVTAGRDGRVILWDLKEFKMIKEYRGPDGPWRLAVSPNGKSIVMAQPGFIQRIDLPDPINGER